MHRFSPAGYVIIGLMDGRRTVRELWDIATTELGDDAPTRAILCAGAGHFARANITLTDGVRVGSGAGAAERVVAMWDAIGDRAGEIVPDYGFTQAQRELASASSNAPVDLMAGVGKTLSN